MLYQLFNVSKDFPWPLVVQKNGCDKQNHVKNSAASRTNEDLANRRYSKLTGQLFNK